MHITLVKKVLEDGSSCAKCADVERRLQASGQRHRIDEVLIADERDAGSPGRLLAAELGIDRAPFFVVDDERHGRRVYTVYLRFAREILDQPVADSAEAAELLHNHPELDLL